MARTPSCSARRRACILPLTSALLKPAARSSRLQWRPSARPEPDPVPRDAARLDRRPMSASRERPSPVTKAEVSGRLERDEEFRAEGVGSERGRREEAVVAAGLRGSCGFRYWLGLNGRSRRDQQKRGRDRTCKCYRSTHNQRVVESVDVSLRVPAEGRASWHQRSQRRDPNCHHRSGGTCRWRLRPDHF